jgi:hypothetical protein
MSMLSFSAPGSRAFTGREGSGAVSRTLRKRAVARLRHWFVSFFGAVAIALIAVAAVAGLRGSSTPPPVSEAPKSAWTEIRNPLRFYALDGSIFGREPAAYEARRHASGGGRQDTLVFGSTLGKDASLRLSIYRFGAEQIAEDRFFVEMARQASQAGLAVVRSAQPGEMDTRFGTFEAADLTLATSTGEIACLGFRHEEATPGLRISGYACGAPKHPMDRRALACALDRLDLISAGADHPLARFFVAAEQARGKGCGGIRSGSTRSTWLDGKPALRESDAAQNFAKR